ncbi:glycosyl hydrolase family 18 protein [Flavobacteriaceae bacterium]|jgi:spore germination protein YaaH|nr:glycosyl hydrolase family 18 protein [Flavobacteriaceae bacterium]
MKFSSKIIMLLVLLLSISSCKEALRLRSSVRRTQNQVRIFDRSMSKAKESLGIGQSDDIKAEETEENFAPIEQKNLLNSYGYIYDALNGKNDIITSSNFTWDSVQKVYYVEDPKYKKIKDDKEVFGWHPYWMGSAWQSYPFELLSTISYFSYKLDPDTGSYTNPAQIAEWRSTAMIDSAHAKNTKVLLTVSSHGKKNNDLFLSDEGKWGTLIDSISVLLIERDADGVDLNFEQLPYFKRRNFNRFVEQMKTQLSLRITSKKPIVSVTLPAVDSREIFDIEELQKHADLMVIMGYDYNTGTQLQGAVAPLQSVEVKGISLSNTLSFYLNSGIDPNKTVLALPYYGSMWEGTVDNSGATTTNFERKVTYREVMNLFNEEYTQANNISPILERKSMTNYFNLTYPDLTTKEIWFDDDYTLGKKYDYALSNNLRGIGIWALGYDNGYGQLWDVIDEKFSTDAIVVEDPIAQVEGYPIKLSRFLLIKKDLIIVSAIFFLFAIVIGFTITLGDWKVRDSLIRNLFHRVIFILMVYLFVTPLIYLINEYFFLKSDWKYYVAFLLGALTLYLTSFIRIDPFKKP